MLLALLYFASPFVFLVFFILGIHPADPALLCYAGALVVSVWWARRRGPAYVIGAGAGSLVMMAVGVPLLLNAAIWLRESIRPGRVPVGSARVVALRGSPGGGHDCSDLCLLLLYTKQADAVWEIPAEAGAFRLSSGHVCTDSLRMLERGAGPPWLDPIRSNAIRDAVRDRLAAGECFSVEPLEARPELTIRRLAPADGQHKLEVEVAGRVVARQALSGRLYFNIPLGTETLYGSGSGGFAPRPVIGWKWRKWRDPLESTDVAEWISSNTGIRLDVPTRGNATVAARLDLALASEESAPSPALLTEYFRSVEIAGLQRADLIRLWRILRDSRVRSLSHWPSQ